MNSFSYDLHVHSCLSPCADDDNTPNNLAGMAFLSGIKIMALTDHNSTANCPAFFKAAGRYGITPIAGLELTTAEEIHIVCLFEKLEAALSFDRYLLRYKAPFKNRTEIFGNQFITDGDDNITGTEDNYLPAATELSLEKAVKAVSDYGGISYPAHIDRQSNGIIAVLGTVPEYPRFSCFELHNPENKDKYINQYGLEDKLLLVGSDAHCLTDLREDSPAIELNADIGDHFAVTSELFRVLRGGI